MGMMKENTKSLQEMLCLSSHYTCIYIYNNYYAPESQHDFLLTVVFGLNLMRCKTQKKPIFVDSAGRPGHKKSPRGFYSQGAAEYPTCKSMVVNTMNLAKLKN